MWGGGGEISTLCSITGRVDCVPFYLTKEVKKRQGEREMIDINRSGRILWRRAWHPPPVFLSGESHRQKRLDGYNPQGCKE